MSPQIFPIFSIYWGNFALRPRAPLQNPPQPFKRGPPGEMAEWLKAHAWKACVRETVPWVRIPLSPPFARFSTPDYDFLRFCTVDGRALARIVSAAFARFVSPGIACPQRPHVRPQIRSQGVRNSGRAAPLGSGSFRRPWPERRDQEDRLLGLSNLISSQSISGGRHHGRCRHPQPLRGGAHPHCSHWARLQVDRAAKARAEMAATPHQGCIVRRVKANDHVVARQDVKSRHDARENRTADLGATAAPAHRDGRDLLECRCIGDARTRARLRRRSPSPADRSTCA